MRRAALALEWRAGLATLALAPALWAAPCDDLGLDPERSLYGSGTSAITPTLGALAVGLQGLPEGERLTIFYDDSAGACGGYGWWRTPTTNQSTFKFWLSDTPVATPLTCEAPRDRIQFAHMGHTPALCPGDVSLPAGAAKLAATVQTMNFITGAASPEESISAEAAYHIYGFGAGTHDIAPWNDPEAVFSRGPTAFGSLFLGQVIGVPPDQLVTEVPIGASSVTSIVGNWGVPEAALAFVSGSNAQAGELASTGSPTVKTLAYQHYDQTCAYLPDSARGTPDRAGVRSGQYFAWTPSWFYAHVDEQGVPESPSVRRLIAWVDGTLEPPAGIPVREIVVVAGDVPLCAMQAIRPDGDVSAIQSYLHPAPCNGWYELVATGETDYQPCAATPDCAGAGQDEQGNPVGEVCRFGFCEAH